VSRTSAEASADPTITSHETQAIQIAENHWLLRENIDLLISHLKRRGQTLYDNELAQELKKVIALS